MFMHTIHHRIIQMVLGVILLVGVGSLVFLYRGDIFKRVADPGNLRALAELQVAQKQADACSARNAKGVGLRGEYFIGDGFQGSPILTRIDATVDFDSGLEWPPEHAAYRPKSIRWRGWVKPPITGRYGFHAGAIRATIVVSGQQIAGKDVPSDATVDLAAGRYYPILMEVRDIQSLKDGRIRLEWTAPHGMRFVIPRAVLFLPSETVSK